MKKRLILLVLAITAMGYISCEKKPKEKDYRKKWIGEYNGEYISYSSHHFNGTTYDTIGGFVINVFIEEDSCLLIKMGSQEREFNPKVNIEGNFEQYSGNPYNTPICKGIIQSDSIIFFGLFVTSPNYSSGYEFKGKKQ